MSFTNRTSDIFILLSLVLIFRYKWTWSNPVNMSVVFNTSDVKPVLISSRDSIYDKHLIIMDGKIIVLIQGSSDKWLKLTKHKSFFHKLVIVEFSESLNSQTHTTGKQRSERKYSKYYIK